MSFFSTKYVQMSLACALTIVGTNAVADATGYRFWQPGINTSAHRLFAFQRYVKHADVVFLGSSRTEQGIRAADVEDALTAELGRPVSAYSFGVPNAVILTSEELAKHVLKDEATPKLVVVSVSVRDLNLTPESTTTFLRYYATQSTLIEAFRWIRTEDEANCAFYGMCRGISSAELTVAMNPGLPKFKAEIAENLERRGSHWLAEDSKKAGRWSERDDREKALEGMLAFHSDLAKGAHFDGSLGETSLRALLHDCKARGVAVILVENPLLPEYFERFKELDAYKEYKTFIRRVATEESVTLFDKTGTELGFDARDYRDPDHMHPDGAKRYSAILAKDVIAPVLRTLGGDAL